MTLMADYPTSPLNTGPFFWLMASVFAVALGYGVVLPVLPLFLERLLADAGRLSVSSHVGAITGIYAFAMFLFAPLWGRLSDKVGRRPVILAGLGGFVVMLATFGLSPNLWFAYISRILGGLFASSILPVAAAYIADMGSPELRARRFAWMGTAGVLGFLAGPMLGGWMSDPGGQWQSSLVRRASPDLISMPLLVASALGAAVWLLTFLEMPRHARKPIEPAAVDGIIAPRDSKSIRTLMLLTFLLTFGLGSFEVGLVLHGQQMLGFGPDRLGQMFVACMLVMAATQGLVFPLAIKRWPLRLMAPAAFAIMASGLFFLPSAMHIGWLLVAVGLVAAGSGLLAPIMSYRTSLAAGPEQGAALGKLASVTSLGQAIGSVVAGFGFGLMGQELFWATAGVLLVGAALSAGMPLFSENPVAGTAARSGARPRREASH